ncbi:unnamed protein product [Ectocarpus sp. CCAP 1310/34]|nr:unnamed protein product [Ectocarpus sp. CCAP 1310/34]
MHINSTYIMQRLALPSALHTQFTSTIMDDMDDVAAFWQHHAEGFCPQGNPLKVWEELLLIAAQTPDRFREALQAAAVAVGARYCNHDTPPGPLPDIRKLPERQAAVQQHAGLCGKYHAEHIANIGVTMVEERAAGAEITTKRIRNQVCVTPTGVLADQ